MKNEAEVIAQNATLILIQYVKAIALLFFGVNIFLMFSIEFFVRNIFISITFFTAFILFTYVSIQLWVVARLAERIFKGNIKKLIMEKKIAKAKQATK